MAHSAHSSAPTAPKPSVEDATRDLVSALRHIGPTRLAHGYGCPSATAGPCTCGTQELLQAGETLLSALGNPENTPNPLKF